MEMPLLRTAFALLALPTVAISQAAEVVYPRTAVADAQWSVGSRPSVLIGGANGNGPTEFSEIAGAVRLSSGALVVADGATRQLRFFTQDGAHLRSSGGRGRGPGEIADIDQFLRARDTLLVVDQRRVHQFLPTGTWHRSYRLPSIPGFIVGLAAGALGANDIVFQLRQGSLRAVAEIRRDSLWVARVGLRDSTLRHLRALPLASGYALAPGGPATYALGFAPPTLAVAREQHVCAGYPASYDIWCGDADGETTLRLRREVGSRAVSAKDRQAFRDRQAGRQADGSSRYEGSLRVHRERVAAAAKFATTYPAYSQLVLGPAGELWVRHFEAEDGLTTNPLRSNAEPSRWSVFDTRGRWLADCTLPARFVPTDIGTDYVLGISRDDDDIESVTLWRLRR